MLRRPFCGMALCFLLGILYAAYWRRIRGIFFILSSLILVLSGIIIFFYMRHLSGAVRALRIRVMLCLLMVCIGYGTYVREQTKRECYLPALTEGMPVVVQGEIVGKNFQNNQYIYELSSCYLGTDKSILSMQKQIPCNQIFAYSDSDIASIGEILVLNGKIKLWNVAVNEGNFDALSFYLTRKIDFGLCDITVVSVHGRKCVWKESVFHLKNRLKSVYQTVMEEESCSVITTMTLGDKTLLTEETKRLYQTAGLSHIMAISGLHISVLGMSFYQFLRKRGIGFLLAGSMAGILLYFYGTMVGMDISVRRALGMFLVFLVAQVIGRGYDSLNSLGFMALVLLWENPFLPWNSGFQFSFIAIIGVVWIGGCLSFKNESHGKVKQKIFVCAAVFLTTLPLVVWNYYEVPLYALPANLLLIPLMGTLLLLGVAGGLLGLIWMRGAGMVLFFCEKILEIIRWVCTFCSRLPGNMLIVGRPKLWQVICYYVLLLLLVLFAYQRKREQDGAGYKPERKAKKEQQSGNNNKCKNSNSNDMGRCMLCVMLIAVGILLFPTSKNMELDILDVGQGDGAFLRTAAGYQVFVDGGSSDVKRVGTYRILPFLKYKGARHIDFWFISHTDEDHISGLREVLMAGYEVRYLVFAQNITQDEAYEQLLQLAKENGTQIMYVRVNDVLHMGDAKIQVLSPLEQVANDKNASSLVVLYEENEFSAIFTGDIGQEQEREILIRMQNLLTQGKVQQMEVDVYKTAHHGSNYSNSKEILDALEPQFAAISCAKKNRYGHPGKETLQRLYEAKCEVLRTDQLGEIRIIMDKEGNILRVESMSGARRRKNSV